MFIVQTVCMQEHTKVANAFRCMDKFSFKLFLAVTLKKKTRKFIYILQILNSMFSMKNRMDRIFSPIKGKHKTISIYYGKQIWTIRMALSVVFYVFCWNVREPSLWDLKSFSIPYFCLFRDSCHKNHPIRLKFGKNLGTLSETSIVFSVNSAGSSYTGIHKRLLIHCGVRT